MIVHKKTKTILSCIGILIIACIGALLLNRCYHWLMITAYPTKYAEYVTKTAEEFSVDPSLIYAVIHTESHFDSDALSTAKAKGLMQLTDNTLDWALSKAGETGKYSPDDLFDPQINIRYGVYVLTLLEKQFHDTETVLAAYNAGQGTVKKWLKDPEHSTDGVHLINIPYLETEKYVNQVLKTQAKYRQLYKIS